MLSDKEVRWIPWKYRLSPRAQEDSLLVRPRKQARFDLTELFLDEAPTRDIHEGPASFGLVTQLLSLAANAIALCQGAHLGSLKLYNKRFMRICFTKYEAAASLRGPTTMEAQAADRRCWEIIADLVNVHHWKLDDALHEVAEVRSDLHSLLAPRPFIPKPKFDPDNSWKARFTGNGRGGKGGGRGGKGRDGKGEKGDRFERGGKGGKGKDNKQATPTGKYQSGQCKDPATCRYLHRCAVPKSDGTACGGNHPVGLTSSGVLAQPPPADAQKCEHLAYEIMSRRQPGELTADDMFEVLSQTPEVLPARARGIQTEDSHQWFSGGYSHGPMVGVRNSTLRCPWTTALACRYVREQAPWHRFGAIAFTVNLLAEPHVDAHNDPNSNNLVLPITSFKRGGLWLADKAGSSPRTIDGTRVMGTVLSFDGGGICFNPRVPHATERWEGDRAVLVAFLPGGLDELEQCDRAILDELGFVTSACATTNAASQPVKFTAEFGVRWSPEEFVEQATSMALPEDIDLLEDDVQEASVEKLSHEAVPFPVRESVGEASSSRDCAHRAKKARASVTLGACFRDVVNFNLVETDAALEEVKWTRALEMWLFVIMEDSSCSAIGSRISRKNGADAMKCLRELFGKKASSTVAKRGSAMQKFVVWIHKACPGECALPITSKRVDDYIEQLQEAKVRPGSFTSFTEAVNFSVHVVGLPFDCAGSLRNPFSGKQLFSPWARGAVALEIQKKAERRQSAVLTTDSVLYLEAFLSDEDEDLVDRYAAGCMLFSLFSRSRISDLRKVKDWILDFDCLQSHGQGFLECSTRSHKTEKDVAAIGLAMPLVAPAVGLGKVSWAVTFSKVASAVGLGFVGRPEGPLLPAPDVTGGWLSRSVTTSEAGAWLCKILDKGGQPSQGITGHSLKSTTLTWACKFGFDKYSRLQLGHHATGEGTLHTYGRDYLAPALRRYDEMLAAIRNGTFFPDLTRSGRVRAAAQVPKVEVSDDEVPDLGLTSFASEGSFEAIGVASAGEKSDEDQVAAPTDHELSSSDSSSSQDEVVAGRDHPDLDNDEMACAVARPKPSWEPGYVMYKHVRTQVVHLCAQGSSTGVFACGRKVTSDFKEVAQTKFLSFRKCKTCEGAKPLRDPGALAEAVNAMMQRKSAAESL
ncbi:unnamed protein product [Symbiodinium sp. CCMP2592]|nr:unnamed protein product [Symbiodinium sp. CCMP2592]